MLVLLSSPVRAAPPSVIPGPADASRVQPAPQFVPDHSQDRQVEVPSGPETATAPAAAKTIHFTLRGVAIEGATALPTAQLRDIYTPYIGRDVGLDIAWWIAGQITQRYHEEGYFLSRAYVPRQQIRDGRILISVVEGYVGRVELKDKRAGNPSVRRLNHALVSQRPLSAAQLESYLLRLNDLPGYAFRSILSPMPAPAPAGAVLLTLVPDARPGRVSVSADNYGSRFLGPEEISTSYVTSFRPLQQTSLSLSTGITTKDVKDAALAQTFALTPELSLTLSGSTTQAYPGFTLKQFDINSRSETLGAQFVYQYVRQRDENLSFSAGLDGRDTHSDLLDTPQVRDRIRAARLGMRFDNTDDWMGHNTLNVTLSRGLSILDSSEEGAAALSRAGAGPDFTKMAFDAGRLQPVGAGWSAQLAATGQWAPRPLFSAEQFGYGGQAFGRSYDSSEFLGDNGAAGSAELRYDALDTGKAIKFTPYTFYDIGAIWDDGGGFSERHSGSSAGLGVRFAAQFNLSGDAGLAFPLIHPVATPIYGGNRNAPRLLLQLNWAFNGP